MRGHIRPRGKDTWALIIDVGKDPETGKRKQRWFTFKGTKREAENELARLVHEANQGTLPDATKLTVGQYLERWLQDYVRTSTSQRTYDRYRQVIQLHLAPALGSIRLADLRPLHLQGYYTKALAEGRKDGRQGGLHPRTVLQHHRIIHEALEHAVRWQLVPRNVADAVTPPRVEHREAVMPAEDDVQRLLEAARGDRMYIPILLAVTAGLRRGEIAGLRWRDIDFEAGTLTVRQTLQLSPEKGYFFKEPKSAKGRRTIKLPPTTVEALRQHRKEQARLRLLVGEKYQDNDLVFCRPDGRHADLRNFTNHFWAVLDKAGLPHMPFHALRHFHATLLLSSGVPLRAVSDRLGHAAPSVTVNVYNHLLPGAEEGAARMVEEALFAPKRRRRGAAAR